MEQAWRMEWVSHRHQRYVTTQKKSVIFHFPVLAPIDTIFPQRRLRNNYRVQQLLSDFFKFHLEKNIIYLLSFLSVDPKIQREKT
jgi:hypothetical protein